MSEYFVMIIMVVINKTVLLTVVAPANNQSKEVEYSGYMPGQAVQVCICWMLSPVMVGEVCILSFKS